MARDRVAGVFLGLLMMWLIFDQLWSAPASVEMKRGVYFHVAAVGSVRTGTGFG